MRRRDRSGSQGSRRSWLSNRTSPRPDLLGLRHDDGRDRATFLTRRRFHDRHVGQLGQDAPHQFVADFGVRHLAAAERDRELHLVASVQEVARMGHLEIVIMVVDLGAHLHFFELHLVLLLLGFARPAVLLVLEFPVVHDPAHRRSCRGRNFDQVEIAGLRECQGFARGEHTDLLPVVPDYPDLRDANAIVDPDLGSFGYCNAVTSA